MFIPVPERFDEFTVEWFATVLAVPVRSVRIEPMPVDVGLIGDLAQLYVDFADDTSAIYVAKLPAANPSSRRIGEMLNAYGREVAFYRDVAPAAGDIGLPACLYAGEDRAGGRWALVLEYVETDVIEAATGASDAQAGAAVDAMADFHARWWNAPTPFEWMPGFDRTGVGGLQPFWLQNLPTFLERYRDALPGDTAEWVLAFAPRLSEWCTAAAREPLTMVHSDFRTDNLLFTGDDVTIIDWQTAMRAPAAMDLTCFIGTSLDIERRRRIENDLIERYLARLAGHGIDVDRDWFERSYDQNLLWWMGQFGNNLAHLHPEDPAVARNLHLMVERVYTAALDRGVDRLL